MKLNILSKQHMLANLVNMMKFNSDDDIPLNKILNLHMLTIIVRSGFEKDGKYYPQVFLDECLYEF